MLKDGNGVVFEEYDFPGLKTINGIATIEGNYPSVHAQGIARDIAECRSALASASARLTSAGPSVGP